jgi:gluconate kinase
MIQELFKSYRSALQNCETMPSIDFEHSSSTTQPQMEVEILQGQVPFQGDEDRKAWAERQHWHNLKETNQDQAPSSMTCSSVPAPYRITQVEMTDEKIMSLVFELWGISPYVVNTQLKRREHLVSYEDLSELLSGIN